VNPRRYNALIAGIIDISKEEHENSQFGYSKQLRFLLASFMREFEHTKKLQQETAALTTSGAARPFFTQTFPAQANAAGVARQGQALCDSTNAQRQGDEKAGGWRYNKKNNKRQRTRNEERPGHVSVFKHSGASNGFEQDDKRGQHGTTFVKIMTNVPGHYNATGEAVTRTVATTCPAQYSVAGEAGLQAAANIPVQYNATGEARASPVVDPRPLPYQASEENRLYVYAGTRGRSVLCASLDGAKAGIKASMPSSVKHLEHPIRA
jgi:hypothetical protein